MRQEQKRPQGWRLRGGNFKKQYSDTQVLIRIRALSQYLANLAHLPNYTDYEIAWNSNSVSEIQSSLIKWKGHHASPQVPVLVIHFDMYQVSTISQFPS